MLLRAGAALWHVRPDLDEGRYLDNAVHILRGHGFQTSTVSLFFGDPPRPPRPEDFSSPLYPYLLAALFALTGVSFEAARVVSVLTGSACVVLTFLLGRRIFGTSAGVAAAAAVALQPNQAIASGWAMTEAPFTFLVLASLLAASSLAFPPARPVSPARAAGLGAACALLYLMRQNGAAAAASVAALLVAGPLASGERRPRRVFLALVLAGAAFVLCLPWFARNASVFGSATYSRMRNVAWAEHARSLYTYGEPEPSMRRYLDEHGARGVTVHAFRRLHRVADAVLTADPWPLRALSILAFLAPFIPALRPGAAVTLPPIFLSAVLFLGVAPWSAALPRYVLPLRPLLYMAGAAVGLRAWDLAARAAAGAKPPLRRALGAGAAAALLGWAGIAGAPVYLMSVSPGGGDRRDANLEAAAWIAANTRPDDVIMEGGSLHQYAYLFERGVVWTPYGDLATALAVAERYRAGYLAVTPEVIRFRPELTRHWIAEGRAVRPVEVPEGLAPVFDRGADGIIIYRIAHAPGETVPASPAPGKAPGAGLPPAVEPV